MEAGLEAQTMLFFFFLTVTHSTNIMLVSDTGGDGTQKTYNAETGMTPALYH